MCGYEKYVDATGEINFYSQIHNPDLSMYLTFMFPFHANISNVSFTVTIIAFDHAGNADTLISDTSEWNDFILLSSADTCANLITGWDGNWEGWLDIEIEMNNETRYWFFTRDYSFRTGFNESWLDQGLAFPVRNLIHAPEYRWDPTGFFMVDDGPSLEYIHWGIQHTIQLNNYYWSMNAAQTDYDAEKQRGWDDLNFIEKGFYIPGKLLILMGDVTAELPLPFGYITEGFYQTGNALVALATSGALPDPAGWVQDGLNWAWDQLQAFGQWLYKIGQDIIGAIQWLIDTLVYYGSIILGILILILAFVVLFLPIWVTAKISQIIVHAAQGRTDKAVDGMGEIAGKTSALVKR